MDIIVIENFLDDEELLSQLEEDVLNQKYVLQKSSPESEHYNFFASEGSFLEGASFFKLFDKICRLGMESNLFDERWGPDCLRSYVNANPSGKNHSGSIHCDDGDITALFFPSAWKSEWGGGLEFGGKDVVEYKRNTLVLFDAKIPHRALSHTKNGMRFSIAFKLVLVNKTEGFDPTNEDSTNH